MGKRRCSPGVDVGHRAHLRRHRQQPGEGGREGAEIGGVGAEPDGNAGGGDLRRPGRGADRGVERPRADTRKPRQEVVQHRLDRGREARELRRAVGNELAPGGGAAGAFEGEGQACEKPVPRSVGHLGNRRREAVVAPDRHRRAVSLNAADPVEPVCAAEIRPGIRSQDVGEQGALGGVGVGARGFEGAKTRLRPGQDLPPGLFHACAFRVRRRAKGRMFSGSSGHRQTSSSPRM